MSSFASIALLRTLPRKVTICCLLPMLLIPAAASAATWQGPTTGEWNLPTNWSTSSVPNASGETVGLDNVSAAGTDLAIGLADSPFTIGTITASNTVSSNSVILGSATTETDILTLSDLLKTPAITVSSGTLKLNARLEGTQGFVKTGAGILSFRDNPHQQAFTGNVTLSGGTLALGADADLGAADNDIAVTSASGTLLADPAASNHTLVLGSSRAISLATSATLTASNASSAGALEIAGPISGGGGLKFGGVGTLLLSGNNTFAGPVTYQSVPNGTISGQTISSTLYLAGSNALRPDGNILYLTTGNGTLTNSTVLAKINLGGGARTLTRPRLGNFTQSSTKDTTLVTEFSNGSLTITDGYLDVWNGGENVKTELRLPETSTITGSLAIGGYSSSNSGRVRIGTRATFNLSSLEIGRNGSSGRIDALAPGSFLRIGGGNTTTSPRVNITAGNSSTTLAPVYESMIDLENGSVDILANDIRISAARSDYQSIAGLRFGSGSVDATNLYLGSGGSNGQLTCSVVQRAGVGRYGMISFGNALNSGGTIGNVAFVYELHGGRLDVGGMSAAGNITVNPTRRLAWYGGTLHNHPSGNSSVLINTLYSTARPIGLVLSGPDAKAVEVDSGKTITFGDGTELWSTSSDVVLAKAGNGTLILGGVSSGFTGTLRHLGGGIGFGYSANIPTSLGTAEAGAFEWHVGTLSYDLSTTDQNSDRLVLARALVKGPGGAATRILNLKNSLGAGTYTLATYASTDLTLADFTVSGVLAGTSAEVTVGPTALTVTLAPDTAFAVWRRTKLAASANTGAAADLADPDGDGRPNLLEYALGTEPGNADPGPALSIATSPLDAPGSPLHLALSFRRIADPALTYTVRAAADPAGPWDEIIFTSTGDANTEGPVTIQDTAPVTGESRRFLRLFVTR